MRRPIPMLIPVLILSLIPWSFAQDPGWPRQLTSQGARLVYYQPQVDEWKDFKELSFRMAFSLTPKGGEEALGVVTIHARTDVSVDERNVSIHDLKITGTSFPSLDPAGASAQQRAQSYSGTAGQGSHTQSLNQEMQNRQRGASQSQRYQSAQRSSGGRSGGGGRRR